MEVTIEHQAGFRPWGPRRTFKTFDVACRARRGEQSWAEKVQDYFILQEVPDASTPGPAEHDGENRRLVFAGPWPSLKEAIVLVVRRDHKYPLAPRRTLRALTACPRLESLKIRLALPAVAINQFLTDVSEAAGEVGDKLALAPGNDIDGIPRRLFY
ncbi:hypothetical protein CMUS01_10983 [Colletotrichum musicola]|uniref:Uncharacterized protein n=1 Tax=Colletotrichum musicola TaxID=2175873 RepID=A0A8H6K071_9PEZI|nr:hypothetical protein CMUS01_10983 [Colletotrichum musicola]